MIAPDSSDFRLVWRPPQRWFEGFSVVVVLGFWIYVWLRISGEGLWPWLLPAVFAIVIGVRAWTRCEVLEVCGPNLVHTRSSVFRSTVREYELRRIGDWRFFEGTSGKGWRYPALRFEHSGRTVTVFRGVDEATAAAVMQKVGTNADPAG